MIDVKQFCFLNLGRENRLGLRFRSMILRDVKVIFDMPDVEAHDSKLHDVACSNTFEKGQRKSFTSTQFNACTL